MTTSVSITTSRRCEAETAGALCGSVRAGSAISRGKEQSTSRPDYSTLCAHCAVWSGQASVPQTITTVPTKIPVPFSCLLFVLGISSAVKC
ncbi:hypothetical protein BaRGS_00035935 [Batillaria attramentaria]|uniref:Uncharacterized protein n=1 Tax=Batillaria attramentaria TaxID=370345 RepID=A0ABD0JE24_9CAEN